MDYLYGKLNGTPSINDIENELKNLNSKYTNLNNQLANKQDKLIAGEGIKIQNNIISVTSQGAIYEAGNGLNLDEETNTFSIDENIVATKQELNTKQNIINDLDTIRSGAEKGETAVQPEAGKGLFSGSYDDLRDKPTIPVVDYPVTDVRVDGVSVVSDKIANITLPTISYPVTSVNGQTGDVVISIPSKTSDLTNDSDYITNSALTPYALKEEIPIVPTNVSAFTNDAGYITNSALEYYVPKSRTIGGTNLEEDIEEIKDLNYGYKEVKEDIIDGHTYTLPKEYNLDDFDIPIGQPTMVYAQPGIETSIMIYLMNQGGIKGIQMQIGSDMYGYANPGTGEQWYKIEGSSFAPYSEDINLTIFTQYIEDGQYDNLCKILGLGSITIPVKLEETINKIEEENLKVLKTKIYEDRYKYQPLFTPNWIDFPEEFISYNLNNPLVIYQDDIMIVGIYETSGSAFQIVPSVVFRFDNEDYFTSQIDSYWKHKTGSSIEEINSQEDLPYISYKEENIVEQYKDFFLSILYVIKNPITLEEKFEEVESTIDEIANQPLKDKIYEGSNTLEDGKEYTLKTIMNITIPSDVDPGNGIARDENGIELLYYQLPALDDEVCIDYYWYIDDENEIDIFYSTSLNKWLNYDGTDYIGDPLTFIVDINNIQDEEMLMQILKLGITLEQKLDEIEPPYTITDYTENNGTLTSITVKDKETGESTILTIGGGKQLYRHCITILYATQYFISFDIINDREASYTDKWSDITAYMTAKGFNGWNMCLPASGRFAKSGDTKAIVNGLCMFGTNPQIVNSSSDSNDPNYAQDNMNPPSVCSDRVIAL